MLKAAMSDATAIQTADKAMNRPGHILGMNRASQRPELGAWLEMDVPATKTKYRMRRVTICYIYFIVFQKPVRFEREWIRIDFSVV